MISDLSAVCLFVWFEGVSALHLFAFISLLFIQFDSLDRGTSINCMQASVWASNDLFVWLGFVWVFVCFVLCTLFKKRSSQSGLKKRFCSFLVQAFLVSIKPRSISSSYSVILCVRVTLYVHLSNLNIVWTDWSFNFFKILSAFHSILIKEHLLRSAIVI